MIQFVDDPQNLVSEGIRMIFDRNLHAKLLNHGNDCQKLIISVGHLTHDLRVHAGSVELSGAFDIKTELYKFCIQIMADLQCLFYRTIHTGIAACLK